MYLVHISSEQGSAIVDCNDNIFSGRIANLECNTRMQSLLFIRFGKFESGGQNYRVDLERWRQFEFIGKFANLLNYFEAHWKGIPLRMKMLMQTSQPRKMRGRPQCSPYIYKMCVKVVGILVAKMSSMERERYIHEGEHSRPWLAL